MKFVILPLLSLVTFSHAFAHGEHRGVGTVSHEYLESSIAILTGVGTYEDLKVSSALPQGEKRERALTYTRQAIALHHAFQWEDSIRSANEALRLDPGLARAYVISAISASNLGASQEQITDLMQKAATAALADSNNEGDRIWVDIIAVTFSIDYDFDPTDEYVSDTAKSSWRWFSYSWLREELLQVLIDRNDPEAYAFWGWDVGNTMMLNEGVKRFPGHSGINHYLTHYNENTGKYDLAAQYAQQTITLAPDAPHLLHMYGHVLPFLGKWDEANQYFLKAHCIHKAVLQVYEPLCVGQQFEAPMSSVKPAGTEFWHYSHNLELFGFSLMRTRSLELAEQMFGEMCDMNNCKPLFQFYMGEKQFDAAAQTAAAASASNKGNSAENYFAFIELQALAADKKIPNFDDVKAQADNLDASADIEIFATQLMLAFSNDSITKKQRTYLANYLMQVTKNPNFDTWSHVLPVLRKLHVVAEKFNQTEEQKMLFDAIQLIDKGHPL